MLLLTCIVCLLGSCFSNGLHIRVPPTAIPDHPGFHADMDLIAQEPVFLKPLWADRQVFPLVGGGMHGTGLA